MAEIREELSKFGTLNGLSFVLNYKEIGIDSGKEDPCEKTPILQWPLPRNTVITLKGRKIVGRDPNISSPTLEALIISESKYISESLRERLRTGSMKQIAQEEFLSLHELGVTHLAQCIKENLSQTMADLVATYSDDRRLPFVVGAIYINAFIKSYKLFYYSNYSIEGCLKTEWKPKRVYIQPQNKLPPEKHELKKYFKTNKPVIEEILPCPVCGSPARSFRVGFRGRDFQVCCTDPEGKCKWFMGAEISSNENDAIRSWNNRCLEHRSM